MLHGIGSWLDPGYLTVDVGDNYYDGSQLSLDQNQAVMSLWSVVSAPLVAAVSWSGRICPVVSFGHAPGCKAPGYNGHCPSSFNESCIPSRCGNHLF